MRAIRPYWVSVAAAVILVLTGVASADTSYEKSIWFDGPVAPGTAFKAGGLYEGWHAQPIVPADPKVLILEGPPNVELSNRHANVLDGDPAVLGSFDASPPNAIPPNGPWPLPLKAATAAAGHVVPDGVVVGRGTFAGVAPHQNKASGEVTVNAPNPTPPPLKVLAKGKFQPENVTLAANAVNAIIKGSASARPFSDEPGETAHSADSFTAVQIVGAKVFIGKPGGAFRVGVGGVGSGGSFNGSDNINNAVGDPLFLTVSDLTTGAETTELLMERNFETLHGFFSIDDSGITLKIPADDPAAFASVFFTTHSSWVQTPYTYGATLNATGLTAFGETPLSDWQLVTTAQDMTATFSFTGSGTSFDIVDILPPDSLFTDGNTYAYSIGDALGVYETITPEPASPLLLAIALPAFLTRRPRARYASDTARSARVCAGGPGTRGWRKSAG